MQHLHGNYLLITACLMAATIAPAGQCASAGSATALAHPAHEAMVSHGARMRAHCAGAHVCHSKYTLRSSDGTIVFQSSESLVNLKQGKLLAKAQSADLELQTASGGIKLSPGNAVLVEADEQGPCRIYCLLGCEDSPVRVTLSGSNDPEMKLTAGQELVVSKTDLSCDDLVASDGIDRRPVTGGRYCATPRIQLSEFSLSQFLQAEGLLSPSGDNGDGWELLALKAAINRQANLQTGLDTGPPESHCNQLMKREQMRSEDHVREMAAGNHAAID